MMDPLEFSYAVAVAKRAKLCEKLTPRKLLLGKQQINALEVLIRSFPESMWVKDPSYNGKRLQFAGLDVYEMDDEDFLKVI